MGKKKKPGTPLPADKRPLFAPWNAIHKTKKDKEKSRQYQKQKIKKGDWDV